MAVKIQARQPIEFRTGRRDNVELLAQRLRALCVILDIRERLGCAIGIEQDMPSQLAISRDAEKIEGVCIMIDGDRETGGLVSGELIHLGTRINTTRVRKGQ